MSSVLSDPGFWQAIVVALIATSGVIGASRPALSDFGLKRRLETTALFEDLVNRAGNAGKLQLGLSQQVAAIYLLGSFGRDEKHLRDAARATLNGMKEQASYGDVIHAAVDGALKLIP